LVHRRSAVRLLALQHPSLLETTAALPRVHGLSPAPSTTAAPPRPGPIGRRWTQPRASALAARCKGAEPGRFPCSLLTVCRSRRPTLSRRYRHGYAAVPSPWPSGPANTDLSGSSPLRHEGTGAHRARPISARFRAGDSLRDVKKTSVPLVHLCISLAGPDPSGSTGPSRLCRGCSHPHRHLSGQAAASYACPAATGLAVQVFHLHSVTQRFPRRT
jgi:hypothetical protein